MSNKTQEIIIGTSALLYHGIKLRGDKAKDNDILFLGNRGERDKKENDDVVEFHNEDLFNELLSNFSSFDKDSNKYYLNPVGVLTLKMSHLGYDIFWNKHYIDCFKLKNHFDISFDEDLLDKLISYWDENREEKRRLSLMKSSKSFFDDNVVKVIHHDIIHEYVAHPNKPVYKENLKDGQEVQIDMNKFFAMPIERQVKQLQEEMHVIAIERWLVNPDISGKVSQAAAFFMAMRKTFTTLTKGKTTRFLIKNFDKFVEFDLTHQDYALSLIPNKVKVNREPDQDILVICESLAQNITPYGVDVLQTKGDHLISNIVFGFGGKTYSVEVSKLLGYVFYRSIKEVFKSVKQVVVFE